MFNFTILLFVLRNMDKSREGTEENFSGIRLDSSNENVTMMLVAG